ncbi:MAG: hypothetical protein ABIY55_10690, partial [Kofleriaceae bacterium]
VLEEVGGSMFAGTGAVALDLPALQQVGGQRSVAPGIASLTFDVLDRVHGELFVSANSSLLAAPALRIVDGPLTTWIDVRGGLSLPGLETLGGEVHVLGPLRGLQLDRLVSIGGGIRIDSASQATLALVLPSLQSIGGDVKMILEDGITSIELPQLAHLGGTLQLLDVGALTKILLPRLVDITGDVWIAKANVLVTVDVSALDSVVGNFQIDRAPALSLLSVAALREVGQANPDAHEPSIGLQATALETLDFTSLQSVAGPITINEAPKLRTLQFPALTTATIVSVGGLDAVPVLETLSAPNLTTVQSLSINGPVRTLDLGRLTSATSGLFLRGAAVPDLSGLRSLASVGALSLAQLDQLHDLRGLVSLHDVRALELVHERGLTSLDGLEAITELPLDLIVENNDALTSLAGLRNVTRVGRTLWLQSNPMLAGIGLTGLLTIGGGFSQGGLFVKFMTALTSLSGLDAVTSVTGEIDFLGNDLLSTDAIRAFEQRIGR